MTRFPGAAICAIGDCRYSRYAQDLLRFMQDPDPEIRIETPCTLRANPRLARHHRVAANGDTACCHRVARGAHPDFGNCRENRRHCGHRRPVAGGRAFSSAESRQLEMIVAGMGLKPFPRSSTLLRNTSAPLHSRSVAARALSRLAMPQLLLMADDIIATELRFSTGLRRRLALARRRVRQPRRPDRAHAVLSRCRGGGLERSSYSASPASCPTST